MTIKEFKIQYALGSLTRCMLLKLARDHNTDKEILTFLIKTDLKPVIKHWYYKYFAVKNSNTSKETLQWALTYSRSELIRKHASAQLNKRGYYNKID